MGGASKRRCLFFFGISIPRIFFLALRYVMMPNTCTRLGQQLNSFAFRCCFFFLLSPQLYSREKENRNVVAQFPEYISSPWPGTHPDRPRRDPTTASPRGEPVHHPPRLTAHQHAQQQRKENPATDRIKTAISSSLPPVSPLETQSPLSLSLIIPPPSPRFARRRPPTSEMVSCSPPRSSCPGSPGSVPGPLVSVRARVRRDAPVPVVVVV
jgi:hypothetical protein